jgi:hypothetical protein
MKRRIFWLFGLSAGIGLVTWQQTKVSVSRKAFDAREKYETAVETYGKQWGAWLTETRWKNWQKTAAELPHIANIITVSLSKTSDTEEWIIGMVDADGKAVSIWLGTGKKDGGPVRSITGATAARA